MESINPLPKASVQGIKCKSNSQESEILFGKTYKRFIDCGENGKASKMK
jgi:hypothetical protein